MKKTNVLILGANGQIARHAIKMLLENKNAHLTLFLRKARKLTKEETSHVQVVEGDVLDSKKLNEAMKGQHIVYANLAGELDRQAKSIVEAMKATGVKRLIFITSLGIYDEVPGKFGKWNKSQIGDMTASPYRKAADIIEASDLEYTIIRPAWLSDNDEVDYETTEKGMAFKGTEVSRKSIAALVVKLIENPELHIRGNLGANKPDTDGDKPSFY
jgi:uncharacterized protein YbjT (DUF2867 family)